MRSKEVEEAIEKTKRIRTGLMNFNELLDNNNVVINSIDKVLAYIEELEKLPNKIRDKIKELEDEKEKYVGFKGLEFSRTGVINSQIKILKSIIGE